MKPITRKLAQKQKLMYFYTGKLCVHGHKSQRLTSNGMCTQCSKDDTLKRWKTRKPPTLQADGPYCPAKKVSRKDALNEGLGFYYTGEPCEHGHVAERKVSNFTCQECQRLAYHLNTTKYKKLQTKRYKRLRDVINEKNREWYLNTKEERKSLNKLLRKQERGRNGNARNGRRRASKINATPIWSSEKRIKEIYNQATELTKETKIKHHVHHIIPLVECKDVCGLHVPENLIVFTEEEHKTVHSDQQKLRSLW